MTETDVEFNPYAPENCEWTSEKPVTPPRVLALRWAVLVAVGTGVAGASLMAARPAPPPVQLPGSVQTVLVSGTPVVVTITASPTLSTASPVVSTAPATTNPALPANVPPVAPKPAATQTGSKPAASTAAKATTPPVPAPATSTAPKPAPSTTSAVAAPQINSLTCSRDGLRVTAAATLSTGGAGSLVWTVGGVQLPPRQVSASTRSATAWADLTTPEPASCVLTLTTSGGATSRSARST